MYAIQENVISAMTALHAGLKAKLDNALVKYDAWFSVLLAILLAIAFTIAAAVSLWCVIYKRMSYGGQWKWSIIGYSVKILCK